MTATPPRPSAGRLHLQQVFTLGLAVMFIVMGWAGIAEFSWWRQLGLVPQPWWHLVPLALMAGVMLLRIRKPVLALVLGVLCVVADLLIGFNLGILLCLSDLIYSFALRATARSVRITSVVSVVFSVAMLALALLPGGGLAFGVTVTLLSFSVLVMPLWWASEVRRGRPLWQEPDTHESLDRERHAALLREQEAQRRVAIDAERRQMASELHDVVSSQVSAIALISGAVLHAEPDAQRDRKALETIRTTSVDALDQLGEMVRVLRSGAPDTAPLEHTDWNTVIARAESHGLTVSAEGTMPDDLSASTEHVVIRVLQESLTNALKHGDKTAQVHIDRGRRTLRLRVTSGLSDHPADAAMGSGTGVIAMQERVELVGGRMLAHQSSDDTWLVEVELPLKETSR
ncbi:sensor histidine kinase [Agrococcus casei]|uniref:sensor histidine kinase n=1 Tax=Agrococcus casei TaxID=343512 RepID=UPI003F8F4CF9